MTGPGIPDATDRLAQLRADGLRLRKESRQLRQTVRDMTERTRQLVGVLRARHDRFEPPAAPTVPVSWQYPWLNVQLALRRALTAQACEATEKLRARIPSLLAARRRISREGWFN